MATTKPHLELTGTLTGTPAIAFKPPGKYVYQRTKPGLGNVPEDRRKRQQCRAWTRGTLRHTVRQQPYRLRFALGAITWAGMSDSAKEAWRTPGREKKLNRFQAFMRNWNRTMPLPHGTMFDSGDTSWDTGNTTFDVPSPTVFDGGLTVWDASATTFDIPKPTAFDGGLTNWDGNATTFFN